MPELIIDDAHLLPGLKPVLEVLQAEAQRISKIYCRKNWNNPLAQKILNLCHKNSIPVEFTTSEKLDALCYPPDNGTVSHQGVIAVISKTNFINASDLISLANIAPLPLILALDQVQDPGNLGTLCRTAYALGVAGIFVPRHNSANLGPAAMRSSAGALERLPVAESTNLARTLDLAEENGFFIYGTCGQNSNLSPHSIINIFKQTINYPAVIVLGNENKGIRPGVAKRCNMFITIPFQREFDSINIAQAGAIILGLCAAAFNK